MGQILVYLGKVGAHLDLVWPILAKLGFIWGKLGSLQAKLVFI